MFFRNLTFFTIAPAIAVGIRNLSAAEGEGNLQHWLAQQPLKPVGPLELASYGWVAPFGGTTTQLFHAANECLWLTLGGEIRVLPPAAVNGEFAKRLKAIEEREGRKLGGRARKQLKDDVVAELLPKAPVKPFRLNGYIDLMRGFIAVDTGSRRAAEGWVSNLRHALGSLPALPVNAEVSPRVVMTQWLAGEKLPPQLRTGDSAEFRDPVERGAVVRMTRADLSAQEVTAQIEAGRQCTRVGLQFDDRLEFKFGEDLAVRGLKFLDAAVDQLESVERDSLEAELDARFWLMTAEVALLFIVLSDTFRFSRSE